MKPSDFPYEGTWEELAEIRSELARVNEAYALLDVQKETLEQHQRHVLKLLREKSKGGKT